VLNHVVVYIQLEDPAKVHDAASVKPKRVFLGLRKHIRNVEAAVPTREFACPSFQFVRQTDIHCHLLHLLFHLLFRQPFEPSVEPDVLLHSQPREQKQAQGTAESTMLGFTISITASMFVCSGKQVLGPRFQEAATNWVCSAWA